MRKLMNNFKKSESGASLVEYAVALIVVTIVGGAGVIFIGQDSGALALCGSGTLATAVDALPGATTSVGTAAAC